MKYTHKDLTFEAQRRDNKMIPIEVTFYMLNDEYYLSPDGTVRVFHISEPYDEDEFDLDNDDENETFLEASSFQEVNEDETLMKIIKTYLTWRIDILENIGI